MSITKPLGELTVEHMPIRLHIATRLWTGDARGALLAADALLEAYEASDLPEATIKALEEAEGDKDLQELLLQSSIVEKHHQGNTDHTDRELDYIEANPTWYKAVEDGQE